ncbi:hypothetical protein LOK49_LG02G03330 [Camellia lanceoleosa]|uniref:Uncharacterized protein n=1 Tax=Camellia lanceoleosa TaxID=1840588 RepID=A0ACC0IKE6_9ERIC|nr:hypothetical protein LOK49_LG02G03330 [Camellia lanceoleosa]
MKRGVNGHISLYLAIAETKTLPLGWEVNANFKLFVYNHIQDKYLTIQGIAAFVVQSSCNIVLNFSVMLYVSICSCYINVDVEGGIRRFHRMKTEWGFDELVPLDSFTDASKGYLLDDCCVFGAEDFVIKYYGKGESVSMMKDPLNKGYTWQISKFSAMDKEFLLTWKITNFSAIENESLLSEEVVFGEHKW